MKLSLKKINLLLIFLGFSSLTWAQQPGSTTAEKPAAVANEKAEQDFKAAARQRLYPGGKDEEPLKVQSQLPRAVRKMQPIVEGSDPNATTQDD